MSHLPLLPHTEAVKEMVMTLNAADVGLLEAIINEVCESLSKTGETPVVCATLGEGDQEDISSEMLIRAALSFIFRQITYYIVNDADALMEALQQPITPSNSNNYNYVTTMRTGTTQGSECQLSVEVVTLVCTAWMEYGKAIIQRVRTNIVAKVCANGCTPYRHTNSVDERPHIHCSTMINTASGCVEEVLEGVHDKDSNVKDIEISSDCNYGEFEPIALLTLPNGATLEMNSDKTYELFCEIDEYRKRLMSYSKLHDDKGWGMRIVAIIYMYK